MSKTGQFLIIISGARPEILDRCPTERIKFQSLGWAILITSGMATVSMWFALTSAMGFNPVLSFPIAIIWGLVIMGIDRWLVTSLPVDGKRRFAIAAPRLALAVLLGSLISTPIVLRIFQSEINNQISIIKENKEAAFLTSQQRSSVQARVTKWQNTVNNLHNVIDTRGAASINPNNDPVVQGLATQKTNEQKLEEQYYQQWQCQLYGGCGAPKGNGPLAQASENSYLNAKQEVATLTTEIQTRENALQATDAASQQSRLQQAQQALPNAQQQLKAAQDQQNALLNNFDATNAATNGLLIRLQALDQLSAGDSTLQAARFLLFLLFLVIEILPVTVKLLQQPGNYEEILRTASRQELNRAKWELRGASGGPSFVSGADGADELRPTVADGTPGGRRRRRGRDPLDAELEKVWGTRTRVMPMSGWESSAETSSLGTRDDEATGPNRLDEELRGMTDIRSTNGYEERQGGIERRYGPGDL